MKIAMVGQFPPHIGGVGVHIHSLAKELVKQGHEVYVITYPHKDIKDIDGIHVIPTKGINIPGLRGLMFGINAKKELKKLVKKENIDIIHGHYLIPAGLASVKVGKSTKTKTYVTAHGSDMFEMYKKHAYTRPIIKKVLKDADVVLAVSEALKEEILKTNVKNIKEKTRIHLNSVDIDKFKNSNNDDFEKEMIKTFNFNPNKPTILFVGNIIKRKNVDLIIEAKKELKTDCNLIVVGDGPLLDKLKEKVERYKDKNQIKDVYFTGPRKDVENIIPTCDLLILPSFTESFGLVLIEALACGKPVIGSNVGGIKEIITEEVGLLIDPYSSKDLTEAIDKILQDKEMYNKFKQNARKRAKDFSKVEIPYSELK